MNDQLTSLERWETQDQVDACMEEHAISRDQINRWRREGLLPDVEQHVSTPFHGSSVHYPPGTCAQIAAAARLFKANNRVEYVGPMLWWQGYEVDERHWRPNLTRLAHWMDRVLVLMRWLARREVDGSKTVPERLKEASAPNMVLSRLKGRLRTTELSDVFSTLCDVAGGQFEGFSTFESVDGEDDVLIDKAATVRALDLSASEKHKVLGQKFGLVGALPGALSDISRAMGACTFGDLARLPDRVIFDARDDIRNVLRLARAMYDATEWIYGPQAFGLRLAAWITKKAQSQYVGMFILVWAALRRTGGDYLSSPEIAALADQAEQIERMSERIHYIWKNDARFAEVFSPKRLRQAWRDKPSMNRHMHEIELVRGDRPAQLPHS